MSGARSAGLVADRPALIALLLALLLGAALALLRLWAEQVGAPESWWRLRAVLGVVAASLAAGVACLALAWRRRRSAPQALPLLAAAVLLFALALAPA